MTCWNFSLTLSPDFGATFFGHDVSDLDKFAARLLASFIIRTWKLEIRGKSNKHRLQGSKRGRQSSGDAGLFFSFSHGPILERERRLDRSFVNMPSWDQEGMQAG